MPTVCDDVITTQAVFSCLDIRPVRVRTDWRALSGRPICATLDLTKIRAGQDLDRGEMPLW